MIVRSILEYASPVWSPSAKLNILKLEMFQRRAARFVLNDFFSLQNDIEQLGWPEQHNTEVTVVMMYKILNNSVIVDHNLALTTLGTTHFN